MIIFDDNQRESLIDFGIEIPISKSRTEATFEFLKSHKTLGPMIKQWHIPKIEEQITRADLMRVHSKEYVAKLFSDELENEIIKTYELIDKEGNYYRYNPDKAVKPLTQRFEGVLKTVAGTVQCCRVALETNFCFAFSGGNHHAQHGYGNGFCMLNDIVIAIRKLQAEKRVHRVWVIDVDAHKGDGTAALTHGDDTITTLSIHMAQGWPLDGEKYDHAGNLNLSFVPSDIDIPIARGEEHLYVPRLQEGLDKLDTFVKPDLAIVVSGVDPYEKDELPSAADLKLPLPQMKQRDLIVYAFLKARQIPRAYLMAGGYGESCWEVYTHFLEWALMDHLGLEV
jgi:acetoin utilization deacetylase AcuC-like enzyme